ncbi:TIGR04211 family SH3 domain-containing protein [Beggiatoa alba]|nr:TIGR04211 family SH3 domain-containing protein [Beggiatoa alba]
MKTSIINRILFSIFTGLLLTLPLAAQAAFITDRIVVEVRTERFGQGAVLKKIPSGTSVEVLTSDEKYTRIRTPDNITGWVASTFLTNKKPTQLEYLELLSQSKDTEAKLKTAEEKLANSTTASSPNTNNAEIEKLKDQAKNARWMKVEMMKARDRAEQAEAKLKASGKKTGDNKQAFEKLRTQNQQLEQRLAAVMLVNEQQEVSLQEATNIKNVTNAPMPLPTLNTENPTQNDDWAVKIEWFFGSLLTALIIGFIAGLMWLDNRSRKRHGGFRIY